LAGKLVKPLLSLYGTGWRERGYGLGRENNSEFLSVDTKIEEYSQKSGTLLHKIFLI
jgi:hypothetical protein